MGIPLDRLHQLIDELAEDYQREEDQAILQRDMDKAVRALVGKEACSRLKRNLGMRVEMDRNLVSMLEHRKRG